MANQQEVGKKGEELASTFLKNQGFTICARNWFFGNAEIDIIAQREKTLHIIEVKTRRSNDFGDPETFVNKEKQRLLVKAANGYIDRFNLDLEVQFDIISILYNSKEYKINFIEDAFYPLMSK